MKQDLSLSTRKAWSRINRGFSLIEVILSSAVFALLVTAFVGTYLYGEEASSLAGNRARAGMLASEGLEAVRNIRDAGFSALVDGTYGLTTTGNQWNLSGSNDVTGMFTRQVTLSTIDTKRKSVTSVVAWQQNPQRTGSVSLTTELTNWQALGSGDWTVPSVSGSLNLSGNQDGNRIQVSGNYAYLTRANATNNFVVVDISSPDAPALLATLSVTGTPTNLFVSGNYAYVTTNDNTQELQIVNVSNPASPSVVGSYNAPGNADANGVFVVGTTAYVVQSNSASDEFCVVNVANPAAPATLGTLNLGATGYEVVVSGGYAFVASSNNSQEVQVVDVGTPASPALAGSLNLPTNTDATTIALSGATLLVGQGTEFRTVDASTPATPTLLGTLTVSGTINDIALDGAGDYVFLGDQDTFAEFQVADITTPASPALSGTVTVPGVAPLLGVAYSATADRAYGVGTLDTQELSVFKPQ